MATAVVSTSKVETLRQQIADVDKRLDSLRPRLASLREEIGKLIERENRHVRLYAEADTREKRKIDQVLVEIVERRAAAERECRGIALAVGELEQSRNELSPQYQELLNAEQMRARKEKIEALRKQLELDQTAEREADRALMKAREKTNRSFFNWRSAMDQLAIDEQAEALAKQKEAWAARSGPHASNQRHAS